MKTITEMAREAAGLAGPALVENIEITEWLERFATIVKAARDAELLAGVEMPEPRVLASTLVPALGSLFNEAQMRDYAAAAVAKMDAETALQGVSDFGQMQELLEERDALINADQLRSTVAAAVAKTNAAWQVVNQVREEETDELRAELAQRDAHIVEYNTRIQAEVLKLLSEKDALRAELSAKRDAYIVEYNNRIDAEMLKLLREIDALRASRDEYQRAADDMAMSHKIERDALTAELAKKDAYAIACQNEADALRAENERLREACLRLIGSLHVMVPDGDFCDDIVFARAALKRQP